MQAPIKLKDLEKQSYKMGMIYGAPGTGKTCFCSPKTLRTCIIDADKGASSIAPRKKKLGEDDSNILVFPCWENMSQLEEALKWVTANQKNIDLLVIDTLTILQGFMINGKVKNRAANKAHYDDFNEVLYTFTNLIYALKKMPFHVVFTAHEEFKDNRFGPLLAGSIKKTYAGHMDFIARCHVISVQLEGAAQQTQYRVLEFGLAENFDSKDRSTALQRYETDDIGVILEKIVKCTT